MNLAHVHLLLNHFPTIGTMIGLGVLLLALLRKNYHLKVASLEVFFLIALVTIPAYLSGNAAQEELQRSTEVSQALIAAHQDAAVLSLIVMQITGFFAWLALWQFRRISRLPGWNVSAVLVLAVVTLSLMARTATLGGEIRHEEIRAVQDATAAEGSAGGGTGWLAAASLASFVTGHTWVWPASEALHFIGLCLLFGVVLLVNLRMMGMMKGTPFAAFHRLLPWAVLGFGVNAITGMLFFNAAPDQYTQNLSFHLKVVLILIAGVNLLYLTVYDEAWALRAGDDPPLLAKAIAASAIFMWVGVIYFGRMLPFLGNAF
jgi:uncharacterized membrane protein